MQPIVILFFSGLIILIKVHSNSHFLLIWKSVLGLQANWFATQIKIPPAEDSVGVNSKV